MIRLFKRFRQNFKVEEKVQLLTVQAEEPTVFMDGHQGVLPFTNVGNEHHDAIVLCF